MKTSAVNGGEPALSSASGVMSLGQEMVGMGQAGQEGAGLSPDPAQPTCALPSLPGQRCPTCPGCTANEISTEQADSQENGWRMTGSSVIHPSIQLN